MHHAIISSSKKIGMDPERLSGRWGLLRPNGAHRFALLIGCLSLSIVVGGMDEALAQTPAKVLFGKARLPANLQARSIGSYAKGCQAGAVALPVEGPAWQAMRLSRNRNWGQPVSH